MKITDDLTALHNKFKKHPLPFSLLFHKINNTGAIRDAAGNTVAIIMDEDLGYILVEAVNEWYMDRPETENYN